MHAPPSTNPQPLLLDGALATELERSTGTHLATPLWSAHTLLTNASLVRAVHAAYFRAGADVAITASYQAATRGLIMHAPAEWQLNGEDAAAEVVRRSVRVAREAAAEVDSGGGARSGCEDGDWSGAGVGRRKRLVAGSIGPYGAFLADGSEYTGAYAAADDGERWRDEMKAFHRSRMRALVEEGVDLLALETMPCFGEVVALAELLRDEFPAARAWVSCTVRWRNEKNEAGGVVLSDGTALRRVCEALDSFEQVIAVGVNCCPKEIVAPSLVEMRKWTKKPLVAYPNSGEVWDGKTKTWSKGGDEEKSWDVYVAEWLREGALYIGGCCRTTPDDIQVMRKLLDSRA